MTEIDTSSINYKLISSHENNAVNKAISVQNELEDKITNNFFKLSFALYLFSSILIVLFVVCSKSLFTVKGKDNTILKKLNVSLLTFSYVYTVDTIQHVSMNRLSCIMDSDCDNKCVDIDFKELKAGFYFSCGRMIKYNIAGLIVILIILICIVLFRFSILFNFLFDSRY